MPVQTAYPMYARRRPLPGNRYGASSRGGTSSLAAQHDAALRARTRSGLGPIPVRHGRPFRLGDIEQTDDGFYNDQTGANDYYVEDNRNFAGLGADAADLPYDEPAYVPPAVPATQTIWDKFAQTATDILQKAVPVVAQYQQSKAVADINKQRISQGLPLLTASQTQAMSPAATVNVGLSDSTQKALIYGGLGAVGLFVVYLLTKKR